MMRLIADENFDNHIVRGLLRREPTLDIIRAQDVGLVTTDDRIILQWAAQNQRILLTHDVHTMPRFAYERIQQAQPVTGVIIVPQEMSIGLAIEHLQILIACTSPEEFTDQVLYLPL